MVTSSHAAIVRRNCTAVPASLAAVRPASPALFLTSQPLLRTTIGREWLTSYIFQFRTGPAIMVETIVPEIEGALNPITALAILRAGTSDPYLLVGEGQFLKVFDHQRSKSIHTEWVFDSQAIHGIVCKSSPQDAGNGGNVIIWGGRSVCLISIEADLDIDEKALLKVRQYMPEVLWDDWILAGCFRSTNVADSASGSNTVEANLVTAQNDLLRLRCVVEIAETRENHWLNRIASGPSSILYSAHVLWADAGRRLLVAAGTVFGEVLLWSCSSDDSESSRVFMHHKFAGHEGSVFGVRISEEAQTGAVKRILASCSDDRTIRIWDISHTSNSEQVKQVLDGEMNEPEAGLLEEPYKADSTGCLAMILGHSSRIWGLRFLAQKDRYWDLMSYGEDSTAQIWRVSPFLGKDQTFRTPHNHGYQLSHQTTYVYHSGKNLWATAAFREAGGDCIVATGGADGRIATYKPLLHGVLALGAAWTSQYTMDEISKTFHTTSSRLSLTQAKKAGSSTRNIFNSLKGSWKLLRNLDSLVSTYPSGTLEGIATLAERPPTDANYDAEYLYSESGDFVTQQGLTMRATRQYVYRYSRITNAISVWFVKPDDGSTVDYFFHKMDFREPGPDIDPGPQLWSASGYHLCIEDNYNANYSFQLGDSNIIQWHAVFNVDGPKKGYTAKATYTRDRAKSLGSEESEQVIPQATKKNGNAIGNQSGQNKPDAFKTYTWINENEVLTTTEHGNLVVGSTTPNAGKSNLDIYPNVIWEHVGLQTNLSSSCIATSIPSLGIALLTGTDGTINLYSHRSRTTDTIGKLPCKAGFLEAHILSEPWDRWLHLGHQKEMVGVLATCLGSPRATVFMFSPEVHADGQSTKEETGFSNIHECHLTIRSKFIVTSSCFLDTKALIVLGSRNGDIAIYDLAHTTSDLAVDVTASYYHDIHGEDAITLIQILPCEVSKMTGRIAIITAGRDGKWAIHHVVQKLENKRLFLTFQTIHEGVPPFGPNIEGACMDATTENLLFWGFRSKQFVVWNESQKTETMVVECGGAHRNWAYTHSQGGSGGGSLVYTKASVCHIHSQTQASHQVIQHGGHGREIKAIALSPAIRTSDDDAKLRLVATGAEDTTIRIFDLDTNLKCLSIIAKHTTGIQQLRWSPDGQLLFSAAGCEEFIVWRLRSAPLVTIGVVCEAKCPSVTEEVDLRIMDFAMEEIPSQDHDPEYDAAYKNDYLLSIVYSDSSVRIFRYHASSPTDRKPSFELLASSSYTTYCLTQATHLHIDENLSGLCTASTDGHLAIWPILPSTLLSRRDNKSPHSPNQTKTPSHPLHCTIRIPIHKSAIKALDTHSLSHSETLLVTGGDDGAITFTRVRIRVTPSESIFDTTPLLSLPSAHASAVTGVTFLAKSKSNPQPIPNRQRATDESHENNKRSIRVASVGADQRLKVWVVDVDIGRVEEGVGEGIDVRRVADFYTSIADAGALGWYRDGCEDEDDGDEDSSRCWIVVAGIGIERWGVNRGISRGRGRGGRGAGGVGDQQAILSSTQPQ